MSDLTPNHTAGEPLEPISAEDLAAPGGGGAGFRLP